MGLILLILVIVLLFGGGWGYRAGYYQTAPVPFVSILLVVLLVLLLFGFMGGHWRNGVWW